MRKHWFAIATVKPAWPKGNVVIDYDPEEDVLFIGLSSYDPDEAEKLSIAKAEMRIYQEKNVVITISRLPEKPWVISSIALTNASEHPLWGEIFRGLEFAFREGKAIRFAVDPCRWRLE